MLDKKEENFKDNFVLFIFGTFFVLILRYTVTNFQFGGDDLYFSRKLDESSFLRFLAGRYIGWTSRFLTEGILVIITRLPKIIWQVLHSIIMLFTAVSVYQITIPKDKKEYAFIIPFLFALMPTSIFKDAGWMATTLNYAWPMAACMPFFVVLKKTLCGEEISKKYIVFSYFASIFACNAEIFCALIFAFSLLMIAYNIFENRKNGFSFSCINRYFLFSLLISVFWLLIIALCPGNDARFAAEIKNWYPKFANLTLIEKLVEGFLVTMTHFYTLSAPYGNCFIENYIIFPLLIIMTVNFFFKKKYAFFTIITLITLFCAFFGVQNFNLFKNNTLTAFSKNQIILETFVFAIILSLTFLCIFASFNDKKKSFIALIIMLAGFCSRMIMAFSPTMHASSTRPSTVMVLAIIIITAFVFIEFVSNNKVSFRKILLASFLFLTLCFLSNLYRETIFWYLDIIC